MPDSPLFSAPTEADATAQLDITAPENALDPLVLDDLQPSIREACARAGWTSLMPVQSHALPYLLDGRDLMVQSRTGSGKTGCYLLPLLPKLDPDLKEPQALILVPTRELALQVQKEAGTIFADTGVRPAALYGGVGYGRQLEALRAGAQLIVGTPGRILDHLLRRSLDLRNLRSLIFDEADRMLSIGFYPDMKEIQKYLPRRRIHTGLFSATYPPHVLNLAAEFMDSPSMLSLSQREVYVAEVLHCYCNVATMDKDRALVRLIETENPSSAIIFCNTRANVHYVCGVLQGFGYNADELSSDLSQSKREEVMDHIRQGRVRFLVATDVAARGIDIPDLSHVFLYEPPEDHESYIHRAGRTGRAGAAGTVISLVDIMERMELNRIAAHYKLNIREIPDPSPDAVAAVVSDRLLHLLETRYRATTGLQKIRIDRYKAMALRIARMADEEGGDGDGTALLAMLLDECHQQVLNVHRLPTGKPARRDDEQEGAEGGRPRKKRRRNRKGGEHDGQSGQASQAPAEAEAEIAASQDTVSADSDAAWDGNGQANDATSVADNPEAPRRKRRHRGGRGRGKKRNAQNGQDSADGIGTGTSEAHADNGFAAPAQNDAFSLESQRLASYTPAASEAPSADAATHKDTTAPAAGSFISTTAD